MSLAEQSTEATAQGVHDDPPGHGPKFQLDIEGVIYPWPVSIIITEQIAELGGWELTAGVIQIDDENNERTLQPGEVIQLKPGMGFSKKVRWKRG